MLWGFQRLVASGQGLDPSGWKAPRRARTRGRPGEARGTCSAHTAYRTSVTSKARSSSGTWPSAASEPPEGTGRAPSARSAEPPARARGPSNRSPAPARHRPGRREGPVGWRLGRGWEAQLCLSWSLGPRAVRNTCRPTLPGKRWAPREPCLIPRAGAAARGPVRRARCSGPVMATAEPCACCEAGCVMTVSVPCPEARAH